MSESFPHVFLPIFMVEQNEADGTKKSRRILNCVPINHLVPNHKFELPTPELGANLFSKFVISIDLKRVCFEKNLVYSDRKYFCFRCPKTNKCFCYTVLPFALTNSSEEFQRFFEILTKFLDKFCINLLYLDDLLIQIP